MLSKMAGAAKKVTTGLTGLAVARTPHHSLETLYRKILGVLQHMPASAAYRKSTEEVVHERMAAVLSEQDVDKLESKLQCGQVEEMIVQAENELVLARKMLVWKPWEPLLQEPPPNQWKWPI